MRQIIERKEKSKRIVNYCNGSKQCVHSTAVTNRSKDKKSGTLTEDTISLQILIDNSKLLPSCNDAVKLLFYSREFVQGCYKSGISGKKLFFRPWTFIGNSENSVILGLFCIVDLCVIKLKSRDAWIILKRIINQPQSTWLVTTLDKFTWIKQKFYCIITGR